MTISSKNSIGETNARRVLQVTKKANEFVEENSVVANLFIWFIIICTVVTVLGFVLDALGF